MRLAPRVQRTARAGRFEAGAHQAADAATRSAAAPPVSLNSALWPSSALVHWSSVVKKSFEELPFSCRIRCSKTRTGSHEDPFTGVLTQAVDYSSLNSGVTEVFELDYIMHSVVHIHECYSGFCGAVWRLRVSSDVCLNCASLNVCV